MDNHSEIEVKFEADRVTVPEVFRYTSISQALGRLKVDSYKEVQGWDTYYSSGDGNPIRHRWDGRRQLSILTVKQRKSTDSIADRHEVDLPMDESVKPGDVKALLNLAGLKPLFTIEKVSYIWHMTPKWSDDHRVCLALYDVFPDGDRDNVRRFLEIEIEKDSAIGSAVGAMLYLDTWTKELQEEFNLGVPLNQSLFEIYCPKINR